MLSTAAPVAPVAAVSDRLPDLRVANITGFHIVKSGGRRLLRFTGIMWNKGDGPFEVRSKRPSTSSTAWDVDQIVYRTDGGFRRIETTARMKYAGDGHDHWHVRRMLTYHLWGARGTLRSSKVGFCFFDTNLINGSLPRSPARPVYLESMCGRRASLRTRNGISVGWGDKYAWNFAYQWVDITGLPGGTYTIRSAVDLYRQFTEKSETNNCAYARIRFGSSGSTFKVLERGQRCPNDHATSPYADAIAWAREVGISNGCDADMFCTNNPVTRGESATFLARAFHYPDAAADYFTDDTGDPNEGNINRIAEAGIAPPCADGRFCPSTRLTRAQIAHMLALALVLPAATQDYFDDDNGTLFEDGINALAEAGIAAGCGERLYCPGGDVTRGQLMDLLYRAMVDPAAER
ncbi:MAG: S-layer homology domain-containing protein [Candidatus Limnocylindrales bacterium]